MATAPDPGTLSEGPARPATPARPPDQARGTWALRDRPGVLWLVLAAVVALIHQWVPDALWLMTHLVLLGAVTHSAMVWSTHFAATLLKSAPTLDDRAQQSRRLLMLLAGTTMVIVGVPATWWPLTVAGATTVSVAVGWHAVMLVRRLRRALPGRFRVTVRFYVAAAACLPVGAVFGVLLARQPGSPWHGRLVVAHVTVMTLGWLGLTVTGTLVTLWPTMLRTRMDDRAERLARQALPAFLAALGVVVVATLLGEARAAAVGLLLWLVAFGWWGRALVGPLHRRPPREFAPASVGLGLLWLTGGLLSAAIVLLRTDDLVTASDLTGRIAAVVAAGFGLQLVTGALSHLIPSVLGGGPTVVRAGQHWLERMGVLRLTTINVGLVVCLLPMPSVVRVVASVAVLVAFVAFVPLLLRGIRASVAARRAKAEGRSIETPERAAWSLGQLATALALMALVVAVAGTTGGPSGASDLTAGARPTGETTTVRVEARDMAFHPSTITVPAGNRLVIEVDNTDDEDVHDLVLADGSRTPRLRPGESATLDAGVVGTSSIGWCSIVGHRRMGMELDIVVEGDTGPTPADDAPGDAGTTAGDAVTTRSDPYDHVLPPREGAVHRVELTIDETVLEVAPGVWQRRWTYNGQAPAPVLRGAVGDRFVVTVRNVSEMTHSIDFHAGERAPDEVMRAIAPGESLVYRFTARRAGIWMYHCSTMPMSSHIAAGLAGAVVITPRGLDPVDREWVLVAGETFLGEDTSRESASEVDDDAVAAEEPDLMSFNGRAFQYDEAPLRASVGETVRIWVLDVGPNRAVSFHVIGEQFDAVWNEGAWTLPPGTDGGAQVLPLLAAQGGFVELVFDEPGRYPFVSHVMVDAERGAKGTVVVTR